MPTLRLRTNLNCGKCVAAVTPLLDGADFIDEWQADTSVPDKLLTVTGPDVTAERVAERVAAAGFRVLGPAGQPSDRPTDDTGSATDASAADNRSWLEIYRPLLLVVGYLLLTVSLVEFSLSEFSVQRWMRHFMGGFFLAFSFFKMLDLSAFAVAFRGYDLPARLIPGYAPAYPFLELLLGAAYLTDVLPIVVNSATLIIMVVGLIGVTQALLKKQTIQCACLGTAFNLPMTKVTFIENSVMAVMAAWMLLQ